MEFDLSRSYRAENTFCHRNKIQKSNSVQGNNVILLLDQRNTQVHPLGSM